VIQRRKTVESQSNGFEGCRCLVRRTCRIAEIPQRPC